MTNSEILKADMLDIIFEHRNKAYGAYALRRDYNGRLIRAMLTTFLGAGLLFTLNSLGERNNGTAIIHDRDSVKLTVIEMPKEKPREPEKEKPKPVEPVKQVKSVNQIKIVDDNEVADMPDRDMLDDAVVSNQTVDGKPPADPNQKLGDANDNLSGKEPEKPDQPTVFGPSFAPSYPGGDEAMMNFLRKNLRTPDNLEPGTQVTVLIKFMVDRDGRISQWEIVKSGGSELDKEVIRVVRKMPAWNPGKQNGQEISMYFTQPVTFVGLEE